MDNSFWLRPQRLALLALCTLLCLLDPNTRAADLTRFHSYEELTAMLRELAGKYPDIARLVEAGRSREGRTIWALEVANPKGAPVAARPAVLVAANFEGDQVAGSELVLYAIDSLLGAYAANGDVKKRLDTQAFYFIPRVNPDATEAMFAPLKTGRKTNAAPYDDDNDGRTDEDGPEDLNNDGWITVMRVKDPRGPYMIHPEDPRLMKKAESARGEAGGYAVYREGIDNDRDSYYNEDPPGGVDLNRNFQHKHPYYAPDAGRYMTSEPESRALLDFVLQRRNIALVLAFGESDNLVVSPNRRGELGTPSTIDLIAFAADSVAGARRVGMLQGEGPGGFRGRFFGGEEGPGRSPSEGGRAQTQGGRPQMPARQPAERVNASDIEYFRTIGEKYRALTGIRATPAVRTPAGAFFEYAYYQYGVPAFSTPGWGLPAQGGAGGQRERMESRPAEETGAPGPAAPQPSGTAAFDLRLLKWMDAEKIEGFVSWTPFKHSTLGDVEIGGFRPYAASNPPAAKLAELGRAHSDFILYLSSLLPKVSIARTTVTALGAGLYRIKAEIENGGFLPTASAQGVLSRSVKPTMVQLEVEPSSIVSGAPKTSFFQTLAGSGRRQDYQWIIKGKPGASVALKVVSQKGGADTATLTLK